jgi:hypothetical protein
VIEAFKIISKSQRTENPVSRSPLPSSPLSPYPYTDKKENYIFLTYKEIQSGAVAKSYMRKGFLIYEEMRK